MWPSTCRLDGDIYPYPFNYPVSQACFLQEAKVPASCPREKLEPISDPFSASKNALNYCPENRHPANEPSYCGICILAPPAAACNPARWEGAPHRSRVRRGKGRERVRTGNVQLVCSGGDKIQTINSDGDMSPESPVEMTPMKSSEIWWSLYCKEDVSYKQLFMCGLSHWSIQLAVLYFRAVNHWCEK